jgi:spermidine synthase
MSDHGAFLLLAGFISLLGQIVLLRELNVAFHGVELIYPIAIGEWMFFAAIGTLFRKDRPSLNRTAVLFILFAIFLLSGIVFIRGSALFADKIAGFSNIPFAQIATFIVPLLPVGLLSGLLFVETSSLYIYRDRRLTGAYGIEAFGGIAGGLLATLGFHYGLNNLFVALLCALLSLTAAIFSFQRKTGSRGHIIAAAIAVLTLLFLYKASLLDMRMTAWRHPGLFFVTDFRYGRIAATYREGNILVFENDNLVFTSQDTEGACFAHLAALQHPEPRRILMIGSGWNGSVRQLLLHKPVRIDVMLPEGDPYIRFRLPPDVRKSLADPAVHLSRSDPRNFLKYKGFAWDLIMIDMSANLSCRTNRFYTREFFSSLTKRLYPGGIAVLRLPGAKNLQTTQDVIRAASIYRAVALNFPKQLILSGTTTLIASSFAPLPMSPEILINRLRERKIVSRHISSSSIRELFENENLLNIGDRLKNTVAPENSDAMPACYAYSVLSWATYLAPQAVLALISNFAAMKKLFVHTGWIICVVLILLFVVSRLQSNWQRIALTVIGGFLGMISESVLILCYQAKEGILYQQLPFFLAAFMAGLSLGAPLFRDLTVQKTARKNYKRLWGAALLIGFMLLNTTVIGNVNVGSVNLPLTLFLTAAAGFLTGGLFGCAGSYGARKHQNRTSLYTADLIGGSLGALGAGLLFIPIFGLAVTAMGIIITAALALLLI